MFVQILNQGWANIFFGGPH